MPMGLERRPPVPPAPPVLAPQRRKGRTFPPPPRRERSAPIVRSPPPLERQHCRGVASRLEQIQGTRVSLRKALGDMPGFLALSHSRQRELRELVGSDPANFNGGNAPGLRGQSIRQVLAALQLRDESSLRVEMQLYDRRLEREQMRARLRGGAEATQSESR